MRAGRVPFEGRGINDAVYLGLVTAKWEIFSGFETRAQVARAQAVLKKRDFELKQALLTSMAGGETMVRKLQSIEERVDLEAQKEQSAERLSRSTTQEFGRGVKNSSDVKNAETALLEARLRRVALKNDFLETKISLERNYSIPVQVTEINDRHP